MAYCGIPGDHFCHPAPLIKIQRLHQLFYTLVFVVEPYLKIYYGFPCNAEPEVPWFNDSGMYGAHGDLKHPLPFNSMKGILAFGLI